MWSSWWDASNEKVEHLLRSVFLTLLASIFAVLWFLKYSRSTIPPLPPGPRGLPILGYLPFLGTNPHQKYTELARVYGPVYKLHLGSKLCFVVSSPSLVKQVVRDHDIIFANRVPTRAALIVSYGGTDIALGSYGSEWRRLRKVFVNQMLSNTHLEDCYALRKEEVHKSISHIYAKIGTPIDLRQLASLTVTNSIMRMLWGGMLQGEMGIDAGAEFRKVVPETMEILARPNISDFFPALARFDVQGIESQAKKLVSVIEKILDSAIEKQMNQPTAICEKKDFLQLLLEYVNHEDSAMSLTMQQVKALLTDIVVAGTDTTATMVEWVMAELMQHPEEMERVQEELTQTVGLNNLVEEFHFPKLHYLDAVVKETLRLHPALSLSPPRCPSQSTTIGGYTIPKGSSVILNIWGIHRDPIIWDNPLEFRPERFLNDPSDKFQYIPFGFGRRICAGIPLAERMLIHVLASLLHSFEWKLPKDTKLDLSDKFGLVTKKMTPLIVIPTPRLSRLEDLELYA